MKRIAHLLLACMSALVLGPPASAQADPPPGFAHAVANARESAWKAINSGQGSGVSVAIMERGALVYSETMGVADRAQNRAVDRNTRFNIGSIAKMFAAVSILMLVDEGKVELDAPVVRYLPEFTMPDARHRDITVRMLFNHSSGLPGTSFNIGFVPDPTTHAVLLETLARSRLKHAPGAMSMYCNDGFTLAEMIVERVTGRRFMAVLAERILAPLGMEHTGASVGEDDVDNVAEYYEASSGRKFPREVVPAYAVGGMSSTAEDLMRFGNSLLPGGTPLLSPASLAELYRSQPTPFAGALRHAQQFGEFGWDFATHIADPSAGMLVLNKGGNSGQYSGNLLILPVEGIVIALLTSGQASGDALTQPILAGLLEDRGLARPAGITRPPQPQPIPPELWRYDGYYAMESGALRVAFDMGQRKLTLSAMSGLTPPAVLTYSDGYFHGPGAHVRYYFETVDGMRMMVASAAGLTGNDSVVYQKLELQGRPRILRAPMRDELWLIRNVKPAFEIFDATKPMLISRTYLKLPGYVDFDGVRRIENGEHAGIAATALRDQSELTLVPVGGEVWVRTANILRSPAREVPRLQPGAAVSIGTTGYNEWRSVESGVALRFVLPAAGGRVIVVTRDAVLHDSLLDGNDVYAPAGSYVFFAGAPGDAFEVSEVPLS